MASDWVTSFSSAYCLIILFIISSIRVLLCMVYLDFLFRLSFIYGAIGPLICPTFKGCLFVLRLTLNVLQFLFVLHLRLNVLRLRIAYLCYV